MEKKILNTIAETLKKGFEFQIKFPHERFSNQVVIRISHPKIKYTEDIKVFIYAFEGDFLSEGFFPELRDMISKKVANLEEAMKETNE